jgi:hypothetical protein
MEYPEKKLQEAELLRDMALEELQQMQTAPQGAEQSSWFNDNGIMRHGSAEFHRRELLRRGFFQKYREQIGTFKTQLELFRAQEAFLAQYTEKRTAEIWEKYLHTVRPLWNKWFREHEPLEKFVDRILDDIKHRIPND